MTELPASRSRIASTSASVARSSSADTASAAREAGGRSSAGMISTGPRPSGTKFGARVQAPSRERREEGESRAGSLATLAAVEAHGAEEEGDGGAEESDVADDRDHDDLRL